MTEDDTMNDEQRRRTTHQMFLALPGYPWLPCPICHCTESCDHTRLERAQVAIPGLVLLQEWRSADHADAIELHRNQIIEIIEGVKRLDHENRRLRHALDRIADLENYSNYRDGYEPLLDAAIKIAKKALQR